MKNNNAVYLQLVSYKAKQLATDTEEGTLTNEDLKKGLREIMEQLTKIIY